MKEKKTEFQLTVSATMTDFTHSSTDGGHTQVLCINTKHSQGLARDIVQRCLCEFLIINDISFELPKLSKNYKEAWI